MEDKTSSYKKKLLRATLETKSLKDVHDRLLKFKSKLIEKGVNELLIDSLIEHLDLLEPFNTFSQFYFRWESSSRDKKEEKDLVEKFKQFKEEFKEEKELKEKFKQFKNIIKNKIKIKQVVEELLTIYSLAEGKSETKVFNKFKTSIEDLGKYLLPQYDEIKRLEDGRREKIDVLIAYDKIKKNKEAPNSNLNQYQEICQKIEGHKEALEGINDTIVRLRGKLNEDIEKYMIYNLENMYHLTKEAIGKKIKLENKTISYEAITDFQNEVDNLIIVESDLEQRKIKIDSERENLHDRNYKHEEYSEICEMIPKYQKRIKEYQDLIIQMATKLTNPIKVQQGEEEIPVDNSSLSGYFNY